MWISRSPTADQNDELAILYIQIDIAQDLYGPIAFRNVL